MTTTETTAVLLDHVEVRLVNLDPDHPGFRDREYRARPTPNSKMKFGRRFGKRSDPRIARMPVPSISTASNGWTSVPIASRSWTK